MLAILKNSKLETRLKNMETFYNGCTLEVVTELDFLEAVPDMKSGDLPLFAEKMNVSDKVRTLEDLIQDNVISVSDAEILDVNHKVALEKPAKKINFWNRVQNYVKK